MATYVYPAVFHKNGDGTFTILFPDLPGCISEGTNISNALYLAQSALTQWLLYLTDKKREIPPASDLQAIPHGADEFVNLIRAEVKDTQAVRRTVSIPKWMDNQVRAQGISLSRVLQEALSDRLAK